MWLHRIRTTKWSFLQHKISPWPIKNIFINGVVTFSLIWGIVMG